MKIKECDVHHQIVVTYICMDGYDITTHHTAYKRLKNEKKTFLKSNYNKVFGPSLKERNSREYFNSKMCEQYFYSKTINAE